MDAISNAGVDRDLLKSGKIIALSNCYQMQA
jgi:hypothetical protein